MQEFAYSDVKLNVVFLSFSGLIQAV